jgi:hypothetical protein
MTTALEVIEQYEDAWRRAALEDRLHFYSAEAYIEGDRMLGSMPSCAYLVGPSRLQRAALDVAVLWICRCGETSSALSSALIHLNNTHQWTWLDFASKFRDEWVRGLVPENVIGPPDEAA